ncbi:hypothetical protein M9H77_33981 [Catharanthus roseus]|uniref:Uncharacterized protein n=1 Tax=Catharanthus roseus TaxID=4058 RepID=A0ACB9ZJV0_CATRO|nr:hypothetical protein M9H77_33981 [Catharanthus roseus]
MVNYILMITAELENLTNLQPQGGCDNPNVTYYLKLKCGNCGEPTPKEAWLSLNETVPLPGSRGTGHLVQKCKFCAREGNITMITGKGRPLTQADSESERYAPVMQFDCRGFEPTDFVFGSNWQAESIEGTKFDGIDLSSGDFAEYDEKGEVPVMISNLRAMFSVGKWKRMRQKLCGVARKRTTVEIWERDGFLIFSFYPCVYFILYDPIVSNLINLTEFAKKDLIQRL